MGHAIDISQLKSGGSSTTGEKPKNPNDIGKNIDGQQLRDFGVGLKEFDPKANGFEAVKIERKPDDKTRALQAFDKQMEQRKQEVLEYNELLDQYGGQISEEDLRRELNQEHITQTLHDGVGGEYEDKPGENVDASAIIQDNEEAMHENNTEYIETNPELDELERELEMEDTMNSQTMQPQSQSEQFVDPNLARLREKQESNINNEDHTSAGMPVDPNPSFTHVSAEENPNIREGTAAPTVKPEGYMSRSEEKVTVQPEPIHEETKKVEASESMSSGVKPIDIPNKVDDTMSEEDKDLKALDDDTDEEPVDDFDAKIKAELAKKMRPVSKKFDLANAVVTTTPITVTNALADIVPIDRRVFTWGLYRSKRPITMKGFTATELNNLSSYMENRSRSRDVFKILWDHIVKGKGRDFDTWLKTTSYYDVDHLWFAVYGACFADSNYLPYTCTSCNEVTVTNDIPLSDMCKFASDDIKTEFDKIIHSPDADNVTTFAEYRVQVSDSIVIGLREPSIYDAVIVPILFDAEFNNKYRDMIGLNAYISNIYKIVVANNRVELHPIAVKQFVGNETKSIKARIIQYAKIIRSLKSDQYNIIMGHINTLNETESIYYRLPSVTCDHCKKEIPEEREAAADLVFMRHRLVVLGI